jgi:hypothetical protein
MCSLNALPATSFAPLQPPSLSDSSKAPCSEKPALSLLPGSIKKLFSETTKIIILYYTFEIDTL